PVLLLDRHPLLLALRGYADHSMHLERTDRIFLVNRANDRSHVVRTGHVLFWMWDSVFCSFFFSSRRRHTRCYRDWSSDVCSSDLSFCSVWRTDGQRPRQRTSDGVIHEIIELRRMGFRFIALADDNFYPVTLQDLELARRQNAHDRLAQLQAIRDERFELLARLAELPKDMVFFTQITMEAAEDPEFLDAMRKARIKGALVGVESVTPE